MKTLKFVAHILYKHYSKGKYNSVPYFSTICALTLFAFFHVMQILILTDSVKQFISYKATDDLWTKSLGILWIMLPIGLTLYFLLPQKQLRVLKYDESKIKHGYIYLIIYGLASFAMVFILTLLKVNK